MSKRGAAILEFVGEAAIVLGVFAIFPSLISGIGLSLALTALLLSGISALSGNVKYALFTVVVVTFNVFVTSIVASELGKLSGAELQRYILFIGAPYVIVFVLIGIGLYIRQRDRGAKV